VEDRVMAFLRSISTINSSPTIRGERVMLQAPVPSDYPQWAKLRETAVHSSAPWEPIWPADDLTKMSFRRRSSATSARFETAPGYLLYFLAGWRDSLRRFDACPGAAWRHPVVGSRLLDGRPMPARAS
jgi:hypothetical protein